jgi:hypothetical protein
MSCMRLMNLENAMQAHGCVWLYAENKEPPLYSVLLNSLNVTELWIKITRYSDTSTRYDDNTRMS